MTLSYQPPSRVHRQLLHWFSIICDGIWHPNIQRLWMQNASVIFRPSLRILEPQKLQKLCTSNTHMNNSLRGKCWKVHIPCSVSRPYSLILLASCCAFFLSRQAREAYLFFSLRVLFLVVMGNSLGGAISLILRFSLFSWFPIWNSL